VFEVVVRVDEQEVDQVRCKRGGGGEKTVQILDENTRRMLTSCIYECGKIIYFE